MSEFSEYSLKRAGWHWPWFNRIRTGVFVVGVAAWVVLLFGPLFLGRSS
jgi:hypothetical protein